MKGLVLAFILAILGSIWLSWEVCKEKAAQWNRCHPEHTVTAKDMFWGGELYIIMECENDI